MNEQKLKYEKPSLTSESFEIEDTICSACGTKATFEQNSCPVNIPGLGTVFNMDTGCQFDIDVNICYHIANPGENVFSSNM